MEIATVSKYVNKVMHLRPSEPHFYIVKLWFTRVYFISALYGFLEVFNEALFYI